MSQSNPQEKLAKFGYMSERKSKINPKKTCYVLMIWSNPIVLQMVIFFIKKIHQNFGNFGTSFFS
jgi:hypothetical protein